LILVRPERFERPTYWFVASCSIQLSYGRTLRGMQPSKNTGIHRAEQTNVGRTTKNENGRSSAPASSGCSLDSTFWFDPQLPRYDGRGTNPQEQRVLMRHEDVSTLGYGCKSKAETVRGANARVVEMPEEESMTDQIGRIDSLQILVVNYFEPYQLRYRSEASTLRRSTELRIHTTNLRYAFIDGHEGLSCPLCCVVPRHSRVEVQLSVAPVLVLLFRAGALACTISPLVALETIAVASFFYYAVEKPFDLKKRVNGRQVP
jgi:hypothetical protein